jgi:hypothetical protein
MQAPSPPQDAVVEEIYRYENMCINALFKNIRRVRSSLTFRVIDQIERRRSNVLFLDI